MATQTATTVTAQLRAEVQKSGASLVSIAEATGIHVSHLSRWLRGERGLTGVHVDALSDYLGLRLVRTRR